MELLALHKAIKKPPRSDERDGELFCGTTSVEDYYGSLTQYTTITYNYNGPWTISCRNAFIYCRDVNKNQLRIVMKEGANLYSILNDGGWTITATENTLTLACSSSYNWATAYIWYSSP